MNGEGDVDRKKWSRRRSKEELDGICKRVRMVSVWVLAFSLPAYVVKEVRARGEREWEYCCVVSVFVRGG